jgi:hypothetical protein
MPMAAISGKSRFECWSLSLVWCAKEGFSPVEQGDYAYDVELLRFDKNVCFRLNSETSFDVSFGASPLITLISEQMCNNFTLIS